MPNDAALAVAFFIWLLNRFDDLFDGEILLIPANFLHIGVKEHKVPDQFHHTLLAKQGNQIPILFGGGAAGHIPGQRRFQKNGILFLPHIPKFLRRSCCGILHSVFIGRHHDLSKLVELWNVLLLLVADILLHGLLHADLWGLALDHGEGDAVDEQHNIRAGVVELVPAVHREFLCDMKQVVLRVRPVDVVQVEAEGFPLAHGFRVALSQQKGIIDLFTGTHQAIGEGLVQILHSPLNVGSGKLVFRAREDIAVEPPELAPEDVF